MKDSHYQKELGATAACTKRMMEETKGKILRPPFFRLLTYPLCFLHHPLRTCCIGSEMLLVTAVLHPFLPPLNFYEE